MRVYSNHFDADGEMFFKLNDPDRYLDSETSCLSFLTSRNRLRNNDWLYRNKLQNRFVYDLKLKRCPLVCIVRNLFLCVCVLP